MSRFPTMIVAVVIGIFASIVVEMLVNSLAPTMRGEALVRWTGNVVSIVVALALYNALSARAAKK